MGSVRYHLDEDNVVWMTYKTYHINQINFKQPCVHSWYEEPLVAMHSSMFSAIINVCLCLFVFLCLQVGLAALVETEDSHGNVLMQWRSITLKGIFGEMVLPCPILFSPWELTLPLLVPWNGSSMSAGDFVEQVLDKSKENVAVFVICIRSHQGIWIQIPSS